MVMGVLINLEQISRNAGVHRKGEELEYFQYLNRLPIAKLLVADDATDLHMEHDQLCMHASAS